MRIILALCLFSFLYFIEFYASLVSPKFSSFLDNLTSFSDNGNIVLGFLGLILIYGTFLLLPALITYLVFFARTRKK